jgi:hypothetical protein
LLGESTTEIMAEFGYTQARIAKLRESSIALAGDRGGMAVENAGSGRPSD